MSEHRTNLGFSYPREQWDGKQPAPETMAHKASKTKVNVASVPGTTPTVLPEYCNELLSEVGMKAVIRYLAIAENYQKSDFFVLVQSLNRFSSEQQSSSTTTSSQPKQLAKIKSTVKEGEFPAPIVTSAPLASVDTKDTTDSRQYAKEFLSESTNASVPGWISQAPPEQRSKFRNVFRRLYFFSHPEIKGDRPSTPPNEKPHYLS